MKELPKVAIRLEDAGAATALHALFSLHDEALKQRRKQKDTENLPNLQREIVQHSEPSA